MEAVIPDVPDASLGTLGLFNQRSEPCLRSLLNANSYPVSTAMFLLFLLSSTNKLKIEIAE